MNAEACSDKSAGRMATTSAHQNAVSGQTPRPVITNDSTGPRKITAVFLAHNVAAWDALHGLYESMAASADFLPTIITIPLNFRSQRGKIFDGEDAVHTAFVEMGLPHLRFDFENHWLGLDILKSMQPDILFRQAPWDIDLPDAYATKELSFTRLIYTDYGLGILPVVWKDDDYWYPDYDMELHRSAWMLICTNEDQKKLYQTYTRHRGLRAVVTGYPKFDKLVQRGQEASHWPITGDRRRFRLIWAPHHSVLQQCFGFGTFHLIFKDMLVWAMSDPNIEIVLKPHPMLFESHVHGLLSEDDLEIFIRAWTSLDNTSLQTGGDYAPLLSASDAMLTDGISFLAEYQLFNKPLIWLDSGHNVGFNMIGERIMLGAYRVESLRHAIDLISEISTLRIDPLQPLRNEVIRYLMPYPGTSCQNVLAIIRQNLAS